MALPDSERQNRCQAPRRRDHVVRVVQRRPPKIGGHEEIEDPQRRAREAWQQGQPEQLVRRVIEADQRQLAYDDRPHTVQRRTKERATGSRATNCARRSSCRSPSRRRVFRSPIPDEARGSPRVFPARWIGCISGNCGVSRESPGGLPLHLPDREMHPDERGGHENEEQHEAARPHAHEILENAERHRQNKAAAIRQFAPTRPPMAPTFFG